MLKLLGIILITGSCSAIGFSMSNRLKTRVTALKSFWSAVQILQAEIVFRRAALPDILPMLILECGGAASAFFKQVEKCMKEKNHSFRSAVDMLAPELRHFELSRGEIEWIVSVGHIAGRYDAAVQADRLAGIALRLQQAICSTQDECLKKGKLYRALGMTAGIMVALIAI